jgi:hypothetical protein
LCFRELEVFQDVSENTDHEAQLVFEERRALKEMMD